MLLDERAAAVPPRLGGPEKISLISPPRAALRTRPLIGAPQVAVICATVSIVTLTMISNDVPPEINGMPGLGNQSGYETDDRPDRPRR